MVFSNTKAADLPAVRATFFKVGRQLEDADMTPVGLLYPLKQTDIYYNIYITHMYISIYDYAILYIYTGASFFVDI